MLIVTGWNSAITQALLKMLPMEETVERRAFNDIPANGAERYFFAAGVLRAKRLIEQSSDEIAETLMVNAIAVIAACDHIIEVNDRARICIIGSESGFSWSFDGAYAASKAIVHKYVETKRLRTPEQQLVAIAPSIIADAGMTTRRTDIASLQERKAMHPKKRFLEAEEVARLVHYVLYIDRGYLSGTVIRMNGGPQ